MAHLTVNVEYGVHSLVCLAASSAALSSRELADLQQIPPDPLAEIFAKFENVGIVRGVGGEYVLAKSPEEITILDIVDAVEGKKRLFECHDIKGNCAIFGDNPPGWVTGGVCSIHAAILRAEKAMRESLASQTLGDIMQTVGRKAPPEFSFPTEIYKWLEGRAAAK
jgi:Rrf2 family protein